MYRRSEGSDSSGCNLTDFSLWEIKGRWVSREGSPDVRIFRNRGCRNGGYHLELTYRTGNTYRRPIKRWFGNVRYFDLYGFVGLAYDPRRDVLSLSEYGDYYRAED
jgi:hypothetical protein